MADKRDAAPFAATPSFRETRVFYDDDEDDALRARRTAHLQVSGAFRRRAAIYGVLPPFASFFAPFPSINRFSPQLTQHRSICRCRA